MTDLETLQALPVWHPPRAVLELAELVIDGVFDELPVRLTVPEDLSAAARSAGGLVIEDAEGTPVAVLRDRGRLEPARPFSSGPLRAERWHPEQVRTELGSIHGDGPVLAVEVDRALPLTWVPQVNGAIARSRARAVLVVVVLGDGRRHDLAPAALLRATRGAASELSVPSLVVPVAIPAELPDDEDDPLQTFAMIRAATVFGADEIVTVAPAAPGQELHPASAREHGRAVAPPQHRGVTVFLTGLSGSGKSTVARALADEIESRSDRTVSLLDGDEVRRLMSAGLGFTRADRDLNIARIGYVAAEIARHGGMALCAPIAPFALARAEVRARVEEVGDFVLVHVNTPLAECERRDRKGLYARARQGLLPDFTGISSPYEEPTDADLTIDTSRLSVDEATAALWDLLQERGYVVQRADRS